MDKAVSVKWVKENRNLFTGKILPPLMANTEHVEKRDLEAFIFENKEDMSLFLAAVKPGLQVNAIHWKNQEDYVDAITKFLRDTQIPVSNHLKEVHEM